MNFSDILSTEIMCGIVTIASLVLLVRSLLAFSRQSAVIRPQLMKVDAEITKLRSGLGESKENVEKLTAAVEPLGERETRLREYYDQLQNLDVEYERSSAEQEEEREAESARRIRRRKMGIR